MEDQDRQSKERAQYQVQHIMSIDKLKKILNKYSMHPDFLGIELTDPNQQGAVDDAPLHIAVRRDTEGDIIDLIKIGADVNMPGDLGNTPLHFAAMAGRAKIVAILLENGARPDARNEFQETPLDVARQGDKGSVIDILLNK